MDLIAALEVLGVEPDTSIEAARAAYRREIRAAHPDLASGADPVGAHDRTAQLTEAWAVVQAAGTTSVAATHAAADDRATAADDGRPEVGAVASDTIGVAAPPDETFALLHEAASQVGEIAYIDRHLGILESIVRFEGGPSCSLLITLQGRAWGTEAFCTLESIEADPTPSIAPVMEALLEALGA